MGMRIQELFRGMEFRQQDAPGGAISLPASRIGPNAWEIPDLIGIIPGPRLIGVDINALPIPSPRGPLLLRIADLWHGDWSGHGPFNGRDGATWIRTALTGTPEELATLDRELTSVERSYTE